MITFTKGNVRFNYRICGVIIHNDKVLLEHAVSGGYWFLPGGRAELGEPARETLIREMREELGVEARIERLLWVVENFFEYADLHIHELGLYFLMSFPEDGYVYDTSSRFVREDVHQQLVFAWHALDDLASAPLYPSFLQVALKSLPNVTEHIVHSGK